MKFIKSEKKKKSNDGKNWWNSIEKEKKMEKVAKKEFEIEYFKCVGKGHFAFECP